MPVNKILKTAIQKIKNDFEVKQDAVAEQLGVTSTYLSDMINGRVPFTETISSKIYEVYRITIVPFLMFEDANFKGWHFNLVLLRCYEIQRNEVIIAIL